MAQQQALIEAVESGDVPNVRRLLACGGEVDFDVSVSTQPLIGTGRSLLHLAIYRRMMAPDDQGQSYLEVMRLLIDMGANVNRVSLLIDTPLNFAASFQDFEAAQLMLQCGADPAGLALPNPPSPSPTEIYCTALHRAAENGDAEMARLLIDAGADVDARGIDGITPLQIAKGRKHASVIGILREAGAQEA